jgi:hypothetical protein
MAEPKWKKTDDMMGYCPTFLIPCRYCGVGLQMRFSIIYEDCSFIVKYKCPACGWFAVFEPETDKEYLKGILAMRAGQNTITPTVEELVEDKAIKRQLEGLGYFGGR